VPRDTLIDFFHDLSQTRGNFLVHDDGFRSRAHSYREVGSAARGFAERVHRLGLQKGDTAVFWSENRPEWIVAFWGCLLNGVVIVPVDFRASPAFLARVSAIVRAKLVLLGEDVPTDLRGAPDLPAEATIWKLHEIEWRDGSPPSVATTRDDIAEIIFTSGATAEPKGVLISHRNVLANIVPIEREILKYRKYAWPFSPLRFLELLPLSHMFGQAMATFIPPMVEGEVVFMRGYNPVEIIRQIKKRRISVLVSVPKILDVLRDQVLRITRARNGSPAAPRADTGARSEHDINAARGGHFVLRWWRYRHIHRLFGWKFWAFVVGAAPLDAELEAFWGELGFAVVQGYGLTETAPIVSLNHPFAMKKGSVGKAIAGVDIKIAPDGEILVRGENVTKGYFNRARETAEAFDDEWFHTGDVGEMGDDGQLYIRGRKKEMIVTPEGLNVFPEDVERVLNQVPGVRESAVVGAATGGSASTGAAAGSGGSGASRGAGGTGGAERVFAVLVLDPGVDPDLVVREANARLDDHQKIRRGLVWPEPDLPRTEGTRKLKRAAIRAWVATGAAPEAVHDGTDPVAALVAKYSGRGDLSPSTTLEELGLSSLDRIDLMVALEDAFQTRIDESQFSDVRDLEQLRALVAGSRGEDERRSPVPGNGSHVSAGSQRASGVQSAGEALDVAAFPTWNRSWPARAVRRVSLPAVLLPLARVFAWLHVEGGEHLRGVEPPVLFAANHTSHMDVPVILAALPPRLRYRVAPAMAKEFFAAHFHPEQFGRAARFTNSLNYYLAALFFDCFPLPQREAGARETLRYIGEVVSDGFSVLIFPEGKITNDGSIDRFRPGIGMMALRLGLPVVPVRLDGLDRVLPTTARMAKPGRVRVAFGPPINATSADSYESLAGRVEHAVRAL